MSKSLGNFFTIREVLAKYPAEVVRYLLTASHYRSQIDYSEDSLVEAQSGLERFYTALLDVPVAQVPALQGEYVERFNAAMDDDLNSREALAVLFDMAREVNILKRDDLASASFLASQLKALGNVLGLLMQDPVDFLRGEAADGSLADAEIDDLM
ncbi:MAG TPA: cysteine--tRNA ligase, partial [Oceanospirillaceae bacterium]|nr:cysteine--tRNA ligase [Oceanospirillaceae bacterium]